MSVLAMSLGSSAIERVCHTNLLSSDCSGSAFSCTGRPLVQNPGQSRGHISIVKHGRLYLPYIRREG